MTKMKYDNPKYHNYGFPYSGIFVHSIIYTYNNKLDMLISKNGSMKYILTNNVKVKIISRYINFEKQHNKAHNSFKVNSQPAHVTDAHPLI